MAITYKRKDDYEKLLANFATLPDFDGQDLTKDKADKKDTLCTSDKR